MNKRDLMLSLLDAGQESEVVPAAFFLHFDPQYHRGRPAVEKHLEYFRATDMDFVKIQFEQRFPRLPQIQKPEDWDRVPFYGLDFYADQLEVGAGLVNAARREALVILTLYSPFMLAGQMVGEAELTHQILTNPAAVRRGMQVITDSLLGFVRECIRLGLDGFYTSTQGGESGRFPDRSAFDECVRPFDLVCMEEAQRSCVFNILHVCDFRLPYSDLSPYVDYPGHVVSAGLELTTGKTTAREVARL
ncbi:MAG TPA: uroporphyrinogen decarboxylase family protein, partial [Anaerolineaceae bacterium]